VRDRATLDRINELAIPPAWREVWICRDPLGHLQATGIDDAGRKQYLYHEQWRARRDQQKFDEILEFARRLPRLRRRVDRDLRRPGLDRERVLACAARLLDLGFFRVGSDDYADDNGSYGLATILKRHVSVDDRTLRFDYPAKSRQRRLQVITDPTTAAIARELKRRRGGGDRLLAYRQGRGWTELRSDDINDYLKLHLGEQFSAKDFRTWNATVLAALALAANDVAGSRRGRERAVTGAVKGVAHYLGNTPAVCKSSYIDPRVFDRYRSGWTIGGALSEAAGETLLADRRARERIEAAVLDLLSGEVDSRALEKAA
jgi:DNA topoisomerase IB